MLCGTDQSLGDNARAGALQLDVPTSVCSTPLLLFALISSAGKWTIRDQDGTGDTGHTPNSPEG
jgi:hypothetical protein